MSRGPGRVEHEVSLGDPMRPEQLLQCVTGRIVTDRGHEPATGAERDHSRGYVGGPAESRGLGLDPEHGHGRLGRYPFYGTRDISIEHCVADHEDGSAARGVEQFARLRQFEKGLVHGHGPPCVGSGSPVICAHPSAGS